MTFPGETDELEEYLTEAVRHPGFRAAYEAECRRRREAAAGCGGRAYSRAYQARLRDRRKRRRR